ncbi:general substrate transporter [Coniochaeta ligniaria NRRL 30616]|uniref:General substrate transporter n=1 Tax=Coniochaeta ligniaria NRRL 30616 TaxID=1408157 RepID=A0A1J7J7C2_9PEZI|nr:general substrate transporter [Coniochaeta ligniaria NRRL 30616]
MASTDDTKDLGAGPQHLEEPVEILRNVRGLAALNVCTRIEPVDKFSKRMIQLYAICSLAFLGSTMGGYDGSLMGNLLAMKPFQTQFGAEILGVKTGIIMSMYSIGSVCALPFVGPLTDTWGRRVGMAIGCGFIILGTIIQGVSHQLPQFLAGRFFLGFGGTICNVACPSYVVEFAHPAYRGVITGLYNVCYYLGAILAAAALRGCVHYTTNAAWLIPTWLQMFFPCVLLAGSLCFPESPRWQYVHGHVDRCRDSLVKYHGNDNPNSLYVQLEMREFEEQLELDGADKRWWDYRSLFHSRAAVYRSILCAVAVSAFSQLTGQSGVSYFLPAMLATSGIADPSTILDINLGITLACSAAACLGATQMDRFGRRKMLIGCCLILALLWAGMLGGTGAYHVYGSAPAADVSIAFIFLIGIVFSAAYTPLQALYPVEVLAYDQRAKGMALQNMAGNAAGLINQFALPVALQRISWKTYSVYLGVCLAQAVYYYFIMVETKGWTLEELNEVFEAKNPRKASFMQKVVVDEEVVKCSKKAGQV